MSDGRKIVTVQICELPGEVTVEDIQSKIEEVKKSHKYDWVKFYMDSGGLMSLFGGPLTLFGKHYQTPEQVAKEKRLELFKELKEEFEPAPKKKES